MVIDYNRGKMTRRILFKHNPAIWFCAVLSLVGLITSVNPEKIFYEILMPNVIQIKIGDYMCTTWKLTPTKMMFLTSFKSINGHSNAQQISVMGCSGDQDARPFWHDCIEKCQNEQLLYVWDKNIESINLPNDVAFKIFGDSTINYLKLQIHYLNNVSTTVQSGVRLNLDTEPRPFVAGVIAMTLNELNSSTDVSQMVGLISCEIQSDVELHPFAYSTSNFSMDLVVRGFIRKGETWIKIGKLNHQLSQAFQHADLNVTITKGDYLLLTCVLNHKVDLKDIENDEMCEFYLMYYRKADSIAPTCTSDFLHNVSSYLPSEVRSLLPRKDSGDHSHMANHDHDHSHYIDDNQLSDTDLKDVYKIKLSNVTTKEEDSYMCMDWSPPFSGKHFIVGFEVIPDNPDVHHILLFACSGSPKRLGNAGECNEQCEPGYIYFAWARNAPSTNLPKDVGFVIGANEIDYLQIQVHYRTVITTPDQTQLLLKITSDQLPNSAGVFLMASDKVVIPANAKTIIGNVSCLYTDNSELHPFAYRTHAHMLGKVLSAYVVHGSNWTQIGKGNPNWPQAFWPVTNSDIVIQKGDYLVAKCVYSSEGHHSDVRIGSTHNDEMCNFYIMYYHPSGDDRPTALCNNDQFPELSKNAPAEAVELLPPNPELDALGDGHKSSHHHGSSHIANNATEEMYLKPVANWPNLSNNFQFGQVSGVSVDSAFVFVLQRGKTIWEDDSFDSGNLYQKRRSGPIKENVIVQLNSTSGVPVNFWGRNFFYLPHGLHLGKDGSVWITDVAMHQVFKFQMSSLNSGDIFKPALTLGTEFMPGSDANHFCKPADVATNLTGYVFVADGYCNNRIMVFDRFGTFVKSWELDSNKGLPHSISVDEILGVVYVADRLNARILSYDAAGKLLKEIRQEDFKPELFALSYNSAKEKLFCVNGQVSFGESHELRTFTAMAVDPAQGRIVSKWDLPPLHNSGSSPHDIAVSPDGSFVIIAIVDTPGLVLKFHSVPSMDKQKISKKVGITYHRRPVGKTMTDDQGNNSDGVEDRKYKLTLIFIVVLCLFVLPLSAIVGIALYFKGRRRDHKGYSHLEAAHQVNRRYNGKSTGEIVKTFVTGKASIPETIREEELKRLESESEEEFSVSNLKSGQI